MRFRGDVRPQMGDLPCNAVMSVLLKKMHHDDEMRTERFFFSFLFGIVGNKIRGVATGVAHYRTASGAQGIALFVKQNQLPSPREIAPVLFRIYMRAGRPCPIRRPGLQQRESWPPLGLSWWPVQAYQ